MYGHLAAVESLFAAGIGGAGPAPSSTASHSRESFADICEQQAAISDAEQTVASLPGTDASRGAQTATTDNIKGEGPENTSRPKPPHSGHLTGQRQSPHPTQNEASASCPDEHTPAAEQPDIVQSWLGQYAANIERGERGLATKMPPKSGLQLALMLVELRLAASSAAARTATGLNQHTFTNIRPQPKGAAQAPAEGPVSFAAPSQGKNGAPTQLQNMLLAQVKPQLGAKSGSAAQAHGNNLHHGGRIESAIEQSASAGRKPSDSAIKKLIALNTPGAGKPGDSRASAGQVHAAAPTRNPGRQIPQGISEELLLQLAPGSAKTSKSRGETEEGKLRNGRLPNTHPTAAAKQSLAAASPNLSVDKLGMPEMRASAAGKQGATVSESTKTLHPDAARLLAQNLTHASVSRSVPETNPTRTPKPFGDSFATAVPLARQMLESIRTSLQQGDRQITVRLNPPELGKVLIRFHEHDHQIVGLLRVDRMETRQQIELALPEIIRALQDTGVQLRRLEVVLTENTEQQLLKDQWQQSAFAQQHGFNGTGYHSGESQPDWLSGDDASPSPEPLLSFTEGSINVLV